MCDNDAHFLGADDHDAHDTLICISMGKAKRDEERLHYTPELYVKGPEQMHEHVRVRRSSATRASRRWPTRWRSPSAATWTLPIGANHAPMVRVTHPRDATGACHEDPRYAGDLTAWYADYCSARFDARIRSTPSAPHLRPEDETRLSVRPTRCACCARRGWCGGTVRGILASRHELVEGSDEATERRTRRWSG